MADMGVATTVYTTGRHLQVSDKVMLAGFEAGLVESNMTNPNHGDRDSLGVFQQRPSQGWGSPAQIMDPGYAATQFFNHAKQADAHNPGLTPGGLAQAVQRSAYPARYDQREGEARALLAQVRQAADGPPSAGPQPPPAGPPNFTTWGNNVNVRADPHLNAQVVRTLTGPTPVHVACQVKGDVVNAEGLTNDAWARVPELGGFVSNIYIDTPDAWLPGVGQC